MAVTSANKHRYINAVAKYYLHDRLRKQAGAFFKVSHGVPRGPLYVISSRSACALAGLSFNLSLSLNHSLAHSLIHSPTHPLTHPPTHSLTCLTLTTARRTQP